jgi:hypothetical protein
MLGNAAKSDRGQRADEMLAARGPAAAGSRKRFVRAISQMMAGYAAAQQRPVSGLQRLVQRPRAAVADASTAMSGGRVQRLQLIGSGDDRIANFQEIRCINT